MESTLQYVTVDMKETKEMTQCDWSSLSEVTVAVSMSSRIALHPKKGKDKPAMETQFNGNTFKLLPFVKTLVISLFFLLTSATLASPLFTHSLTTVLRWLL